MQRLFRMKQFLKSILLIVVVGTLPCAAAAQNILPKSFAGWMQTGEVKTAGQPGQADAANAAVLNEYGFTGSETATYKRPDGRTLTIAASRFKDATGAYGAFTFFRDPAMKVERIGTKAASANERILFFRSNVLVDAKFDRITGMSGAELRELAGMLPEAAATAANLPNLPEYLPKQGVVENSAKYILGPQALAATKTPLSADLVSFATEPEILTQNYTTADGPVTLMLVQYPTPQIAIERLRAFQASPDSGKTFSARRTGPIIVATSGNVESSGAKALLNSVNYEAEVTWNEATAISKRDNIGNLLLAVFGLIGILLVFGLIFGVFFGGIRLLLTRYFPGTVFDLPENVEILQLHLRDGSAADK
ncbi:MAG TPA: DUF6599 family protein [Terriglobales bacterium]